MRPELIPWLLLLPLLLLGAGLTWAQQAPARERGSERVQREARALLTEAQRRGASATPAQRAALLDGLKRAGAPLLGPTSEVAFVLHAPGARAVQLVADFNNWGQTPLALERVGGTDVFLLERTFQAAARIEYQFVVDGRWRLDPWNARTVDNGLGGKNSWVALAGYVAARPALPSGAARGILSAEVRVGGHRVRVYLPAGYDPKRAEAYPLQVFQDGHDYLARGAAAGWLDQLIATQAIPPLVGVFVSPVDRMKEYWVDPGYVRFVTRTLLPWIEQRYHLSRSRSDRGVLGDSLGGLISVHLAYARPDVFGRVASQSGAFYPRGRGPLPPTKLFERVRGAKQHPDRLYLSVGLYEPNLLPQNRALRALLAKLPGAPTPVFHEEPEGHTWTFWQRDLPRALRALWGKPTPTTPRGR